LISPFSYVRLIEMLGGNPDSISVISDSELRRLIRNRPKESNLGALVTAEVYFRAWLYDGASREEMRAELAGCQDPVIDRLFDDLLKAIRAQPSWDGEVHEVMPVQGCTRLILERLIARIRAFMRADGVIPVVTGEKAEAIPIAFNFRVNESTDTAIRDVTGIPIPLWDEAFEMAGDLCAQHIGIQLQCSLRGTGRQLDGESFELPVMLALARKRGALPDYPVLCLMATGAIRGDAVAAVAGIDAKTALAKRMGVKLFVTPGVASNDFVMGVPAGATIKGLLGSLKNWLERADLGRLDTRTASVRLNCLGDEIHMGVVSVSDATTRLNRYEKILEQDTMSRTAAEGMIRINVLKGALANHAGDPKAGIQATQVAASLAIRHRMPLLYVNAMANRIVSLTDIGQLASAESEGRRLLDWVHHDFSGPAAEQLQAEMVACGVVGGQPLMLMALQGSESGPESLRLLSRAFEIAKELNFQADICRDAVQIALWHALLDPVHTDAAVEKTRSVLDGHPGEWSTACDAYLQRARFLGAYRSVLCFNTKVEGFSAWPLPEAKFSSLNWVRAMAQKYRGALYARQGMIVAAEEDFESAWSILDRESAPLLRFIGGTVALSAGEVLLVENQSLATAYLQHAKGIFLIQSDHIEGSLRGSPWLRRTEGLLNGSLMRDLPDPQKVFPF